MNGYGVTEVATAASSLIVELEVGGQLCGLPINAVRDVLAPQTITRVPLAPDDVAGNLNLRGRVVLAIDLRVRLGVAVKATGPAMSVVTEHGTELYALLVDRVIEVVNVSDRAMTPLPPTLGPGWSRFGTGIYQLNEGLLVMLDVDRLLSISARTP